MPKDEQLYESKGMNKGVNTNDSARNIDPDQCSKNKNVKLRIEGGIESLKGKTKVNSAITTFGTYLANVGGIYYAYPGSNDYGVVAQHNGTSTKIYAINLSTGTVTLVQSSSITNTDIVDFEVIGDKLYWSAKGSTSIYSWDGGLTTAASLETAAQGTIPSSTKALFQYNRRLGVANDSSNPSELTLTAYGDHDWWDATNGNGAGDKAFQVILDANQDEEIRAVVSNVFNTVIMLREKSIYALKGSSESDWVVVPITTDIGCKAPRTAVRGNNSVWYLSQFGVKQISGAREVTDANRFDSIITTSITRPIQNKFDQNKTGSYTTAQITAAFAVMYNDAYYLSIGDNVWVFDLLANSGEGALYNADVFSGCNSFIDAGDNLYGMDKATGYLYKLGDGDNDIGAGYEKYQVTKDHDFGLPRNLKNFNEVRIYGDFTGDYSIYCDVYIDGADIAAKTFTVELNKTTNYAYYMFDSGTSSGTGTGTLTDSTKTWTVNEFADYFLVDSNSVIYTILSNTATALTVSGGNPASGAYSIVPTKDSFYTDEDDTNESFASFYLVKETSIDDGDRCFLRGKSIKLKFYNETADEDWRIDKYQIIWEPLLHTSYNLKNK